MCWTLPFCNVILHPSSAAFPAIFHFWVCHFTEQTQGCLGPLGYYGSMPYLICITLYVQFCKYHANIIPSSAQFSTLRILCLSVPTSLNVSCLLTRGPVASSPATQPCSARVYVCTCTCIFIYCSNIKYAFLSLRFIPLSARDLVIFAYLGLSISHPCRLVSHLPAFEFSITDSAVLQTLNPASLACHAGLLQPPL